MRHFATLRRSLSLLTSFPNEQRNPDEFYSNLAEDTARLIEQFAPLSGTRVLDVGGGPGYFVDAFARRKAWYIGVDPFEKSHVKASGHALPFHNDTFDITYSSNVVEHISDPWKMCEEMLRVTKPGGFTIVSYTIWLGPFGGHETGLWQHYIGGEYARDRYTRKHGRPPKNVFGESLFDVSCADGLQWARSVQGAKIVREFPRYHPWWAWWLVKIPGVREFLVSNLVVVLQKETLPPHF
ncbi:class I SAM-dependent methyltransferase [Corynebacterium freiburgense]|uniref:class I SAM-dependent methyltransferase n=1 Tax=Corynebacterium freiburgense TaxID=556548 RepID=UPI00042421EB|nr:class I SAM-dependent methyltransferase [Corynebacterium freiburgense]WJZ03852.1 putative methyltransferase [Corynebacterium freiburgense]